MTPGDVVRLKVGGPRMVVQTVKTTWVDGESRTYVECVWFDDKNRARESTFRAEGLIGDK